MIIADKKKDVVISSDFKTSGFTIQASAKAFEILSSNIYTNKVRAVIREISCNAQDSHVAAGQSCAIKVHLPTQIEPHFSVRDFGVGLDDESIREIFTTYFLSTKTGSNDYTGALGLGSKSPFCLVDSFVVTAWKDGIKNTYSCYKDENGEPQIALLTSESSDEPTGLEVSLAVETRTIPEFYREAAFVYRYFEQLPDINDKSIYDIIKEYEKTFNIVTDWYGISTQPIGLYAVMGNVAYEIPEDYLYEYSLHSTNGYIKFNMGEISFNPGRESLSLDNKTKATLDDKLNKLMENIVERIDEQIDAEKNLYLKYCLACSFTDKRLAHKSKSYVKAVGLYSAKRFTVYKPSYGRRVSKYNGNEPVNNCEFYKYKQGFDRRIEAYVRDTRKTVIIIDDEAIKELDIPAHMILDIETIPKIKYNRSTKSSSVRNKDINVYNIDGMLKNTINYLPTEQKVYVELYGHGNSLNTSYEEWFSTIRKISHLLRFLHANNLIDDNFVFYGVRKITSESKAFKNDKTWIRFDEFFKKLVDGKVFPSYNDLDNGDLEKINCIYKESKDERLKFAAKKHNHCDMPDFVKLEQDPLGQQVKDFMQKHSMLNFIANWEINKHTIETIINYINLVGAN